MKRILAVAIGGIVWMLCIVAPVSAASTDELLEGQLEASGATELYDALPPHTQSLLETLGIDALTLEGLTALQPQTVLSSLGDLLSDQAMTPVSAVGTMLGMLLLLGLFSSLHPNGGREGELVSLLTSLAVLTPLLIPLWQTVARAASAAESAAVFSVAFAPVYASSLAAQGLTMSSVTHHTLMLAAAQGISMLTQGVIVPLLSMALALGVSGSIHKTARLSEIGTLVNRVATWLLGLSLTVFVGMLSLQGVLSASADSIGGRVMRFSVSGLVPVVGGSLSDALYTVRGCLSALRGTIGTFGIFSTVLIVLPTMLECAVWSAMLYIAKLAADLFSLSSIASAVETARGVVRTLIGVLASCALLMIVSVTLTMTVGGGVG